MLKLHVFGTQQYWIRVRKECLNCCFPLHLLRFLQGLLSAGGQHALQGQSGEPVRCSQESSCGNDQPGHGERHQQRQLDHPPLPHGTQGCHPGAHLPHILSGREHLLLLVACPLTCFSIAGWKAYRECCVTCRCCPACPSLQLWA